MQSPAAFLFLQLLWLSGMKWSPSAFTRNSFFRQTDRAASSGKRKWDLALCLLHTIDCLNERNNYDGKAVEQADTQLIHQMKLVAIETCSSNSMQLLCLEGAKVNSGCRCRSAVQ
ncbi:uncharacterized protein FN964_009179 isoform 1-T3 [Alca torda]